MNILRFFIGVVSLSVVSACAVDHPAFVGGTDATIDTPPDTLVDAGEDMIVVGDMSVDALDVAVDMRVDADDMRVDAGPDMRVDAGPDMGVDAGSDMGVDAGECTPGSVEACGPRVGICVGAVRACSAAARWGACTPAPAVDETCNGLDDDCDGETDEGLIQAWYLDADHDGFGSLAAPTLTCVTLVGFVNRSGDCDDLDDAIHPDAREVCDLVDNDCDGATDEDVTPQWYPDADGDGHGEDTLAFNRCEAPMGYVSSHDDCNDTDGAIHPGQTDVCDLVDNDCDGVTDPANVCHRNCESWEREGHVYLFCARARTWQQARNQCRGYAAGYELVSLTSSAENTDVTRRAGLIASGEWWTGFNDRASENDFVWVSGEVGPFLGWVDPEPNNFAGNEDCGTLTVPSGNWNDIWCPNLRWYICEGAMRSELP